MNLDSASLTQYLNKVAAKETENGKVVSCYVVPDYSASIAKEIKRVHLISRHQAYKYKKPFCNCLVKKKVKNPYEFEDELRRLEREIKDDQERPIQGTGVAYFTADSIETATCFEKIVSYSQLSQI